MSDVEVRIPDIGDFDSVDVIDVHVKPGDSLNPEDPLITLETDKATMDVPAPSAGTVASVAIRKGSKAKAGDLILTLTPADERCGGEAGCAGEAGRRDCCPRAGAAAPSRARGRVHLRHRRRRAPLRRARATPPRKRRRPRDRGSS